MTLSVGPCWLVSRTAVHYRRKNGELLAVLIVVVVLFFCSRESFYFILFWNETRRRRYLIQLKRRRIYGVLCAQTTKRERRCLLDANSRNEWRARGLSPKRPVSSSYPLVRIKSLHLMWPGQKRQRHDSQWKHHEAGCYFSSALFFFRFIFMQKGKEYIKD